MNGLGSQFSQVGVRSMHGDNAICEAGATMSLSNERIWVAGSVSFSGPARVRSEGPRIGPSITPSRVKAGSERTIEKLKKLKELAGGLDSVRKLALDTRHRAPKLSST